LESIEEAKKAIELDPDLNIAYVNLAYSYYSMNRFNDAQRHDGARSLIWSLLCPAVSAR
jgi:hypothetical protein